MNVAEAKLDSSNVSPRLKIDGKSRFGIVMLLLAIPLLIWQFNPSNQIDIPPHDYLVIHTMMEVFAVIVAALIFSVSYGAHEFNQELRFVALGYAFLAVAIFDLFHFLSFAGMPYFISQNTPHKAILLWLAGRITVLIGIAAYLTISNTHTISRINRNVWFSVTVAASMAIGISLVKFPDALPPTFIPGSGLTPLKIFIEWMLFAGYVAAAIFLYLKRRNLNTCDVSRLILGLLLLAVGELFFTMYARVTNTANFFGHVYKVIAYYFLYLALYAETIRQPFLRMRHIVAHDDLTGLLSRNEIYRCISKSIELSGKNGSFCAIILVNLDRFQNINDSYGHDFGDEVLVAVSSRLKSTLPQQAQLARLGSDEFVLLLNDTRRDQAKFIAESIRKNLAESFALSKGTIEIRASMGIASCGEHAKTANTLLRFADFALHRAKETGRNCTVEYSNDLSETIERRVLIETNIRASLQRNEFSLAYQPKLDLLTQRIVGWEALLRWQNSQLGAIGPNEFIPVAEDSGLIIPLGDYALRESCRQAREWHELGLRDVPVAVNLSNRQFRQRDLAQKIEKILHETGLPPAMLNIEITESAIMDDITTAVAIMKRLRKLGIQIALDDFGTGYSSLSYLKIFPIQYLKIDRSFVRGLPNNDHDVAITRAIIALAKSLGMAVIAEGVETVEQQTFLRENGCDQVQGFLFSRPIPPEGCVNLFNKINSSTN